MLHKISYLIKRYFDSLLIFKIINLLLSFSLLALYIKLDLIELQSIILISLLVQLIHPGLEYQLMVKVLPDDLFSVASAYNVAPIIFLIISTAIFSLNEVLFLASLLIVRISDMFINLLAIQDKKLHSKIGILWLALFASIICQIFWHGYVIVVFDLIILVLISKPSVQALRQNSKQILTSYCTTLLYALPNITVGTVGMTSSVAMQEAYLVLSRSYGIVQKVIQVIRVRLLPHAINVRLGYKLLSLSIVLGTFLLVSCSYILALYFNLGLSFTNGLFTFYIVIMSYSIYNNIMPVFLKKPTIRIVTDISSTGFLILIAANIESDEIILWLYSVFISIIYLIRGILEIRVKA